MWLHCAEETGVARRHAPDFFARRADGTGVLIDVRPQERMTVATTAVFTVTAALAARVGWDYRDGRGAGSGGCSVRHPVLRAGDTLRRAGALHTVAALDGATVRLADVTGTVTETALAALLADPGVEVVSSARVPMAPTSALDGLPDDAAATARWWEQHLLEVITGLAPDNPAGARPRPEYDPATRSLRQRELAKHAQLVAEGPPGRVEHPQAAACSLRA